MWEKDGRRRRIYFPTVGGQLVVFLVHFFFLLNHF